MAATENPTLSVLSSLSTYICAVTCVPMMMFMRYEARKKQGIEGTMLRDCFAMSCCRK